MKQRVAILIYSLASGGAEKQVSLLLKYLSNKYKIYLVLMNNTIFYEIPKNIEIAYIEQSSPRESGVKKFLKLPFLSLKYKKFLKKNKIDISISFMNRPNYINALAKITKTILSERISPLNEYKTNSTKNIVNRFLINVLYKKADLVIPNSKRTALELRNFFNIKNIKTIYNMIELPKCKKENNEFIFIHIGRFEPQKNHFLLFEAFKQADLNAKL